MFTDMGTAIVTIITTRPGSVAMIGVIRIMGTGLMPVGMSKGIQPIGAMGEQSASVTAARTK